MKPEQSPSSQESSRQTLQPGFLPTGSPDGAAPAGSSHLENALRQLLEGATAGLPAAAAAVVLAREETACCAWRLSARQRLHLQTVKVSPQDLQPLVVSCSGRKAVRLKIQPAFLNRAEMDGFTFVWASTSTGEDLTEAYAGFGTPADSAQTDEAVTRVQMLAAGAAAVTGLACRLQDLETSLQVEQTRHLRDVNTEKLVALERMVAQVAHELNNPLQIIKNCLFLAQQELDPDSPQQEYLSLAASEIQRLTTMVTQLLDLYRPQESRPEGEVEIYQLLEDVHRLLKPHLDHQKVDWMQAPGGGESLTVRGDSDQLKQVFLNICMNAIEAMQPEGGKLYISVEHDCKSGQVRIHFRDTGPGIAHENLPKIFEPFFTTKEYGIGLGLLISHEIIARHMGTITVENLPDQGALFTVCLPC